MFSPAYTIESYTTSKQSYGQSEQYFPSPIDNCPGNDYSSNFMSSLKSPSIISNSSYASTEDNESIANQQQQQVSTNNKGNSIKVKISMKAKFNLKKSLDLKAISQKVLNSTYDKKTKTLKYQVRKSDILIELKENGDGVCTQARCEEDAHLACRRLARMIQKKGFSVKFQDFHIFNISYKVDLGREIDLDFIDRSQAFSRTQYEPELFEGLVLKENGMVCTIDNKGVFFLNGAKNLQSAHDFMKKLQGVIAQSYYQEDGRDCQSYQVPSYCEELFAPAAPQYQEEQYAEDNNSNVDQFFDYSLDEIDQVLEQGICGTSSPLYDSNDFISYSQ